ncbi:MAG: sigma-70 family RNA polymerase sigma factor [Sedimentisphaerales bacterium]|nr:sigma-70 family RNA polymerase sigma factor [Sedimentisphaerales bacterium]
MENNINRITQAEQYLLDKIRLGNTQAWSEFVDRYRGRLLSFARSKLLQAEDAEDTVQETFVSFIKNLQTFRGDCALETYLFSLLRRKIVDTYRSQKTSHICLIQDTFSSDAEESASDPFEQIAGHEQTASWYFKADEQLNLQKNALTDALCEVVESLKESLNFRDLQIIELLLYCHISNKDVAKIMDINDKHVALIKHRCIKQIRGHIETIPSGPSSAEFENLLTDIWKMQRFSCPKRSTIGAFFLGTLDKNWHDYIDFHINKIGCQFCLANLEDIKTENAKKKDTKFQSKIMESTVGFLKKP